MTVSEFAAAVKALVEPWGGNVTRWGSTNAHSKAIGGFSYDPHTWWLGMDVVYDGTDDSPRDLGHPLSPLSCRICSTTMLKVIHEATHDHIQPMDFPAGPVHTYGGVTRP